MSPIRPAHLLHYTLLAYGFFCISVYHMSYAQSNIKIQQHPATYFEHASSELYLEHDAIGIELQLHVPEVVSMGQKTLKAHYEYFLTLFNQTVPKQGSSSKEDHLQTLLSLYLHQIELHPNCDILSPAHSATHHAAMILEQQILELSRDIKFPHPDPLHQDRQATRAWDLSRVKRELNVNLDANAVVQSFFNGIFSIFHMHSISEVRKGLRNQAKRLDKLTQFTVSYARKTTSLLGHLSVQVNNLESQFQAVTTDLALIMVSTKMAGEILTSLTELYQGIIPTAAMTPSEASSIFQSLQKQARKADQRLVLEQPAQLFKLKVTTYVKDTGTIVGLLNPLEPATAPRQYDYFCLLTVPTIRPRSGLRAYFFNNNPFRLPSGKSAIWNQEQGLFAVRPTIYPQEVEYSFIPHQAIQRSCRKYPSAWLCDAPVIHKRSCVSDLFHNTSASCTTTSPLHDDAHLVHSEHLLLYFPNDTKIMITCPQSAPVHQRVQGLIQIEDRPGCQLTSSVLSYTFNGVRPSVTISKTTHAVIPHSAFNFTVPKYSDSPTNHLATQVQDIQDSISTFRNSLNDTLYDQGSDNDDILALYILAISALAASAALAFFCLYHIIRACIINRGAAVQPQD